MRPLQTAKGINATAVATLHHHPLMAMQQVPKRTYSNGPVVKKENVFLNKECRKNHVASTGGYVVDGCREFMASGEEGTPAALLCAACSCHRSFHKREVKPVTEFCEFSSKPLASVIIAVGTPFPSPTRKPVGISLCTSLVDHILRWS